MTFDLDQWKGYEGKAAAWVVTVVFTDYDNPKMEYTMSTVVCFTDDEQYVLRECVRRWVEAAATTGLVIGETDSVRVRKVPMKMELLPVRWQISRIEPAWLEETLLILRTVGTNGVKRG